MGPQGELPGGDPGNANPTISDLRPGRRTRDRTPTLRATVLDADATLTEVDLRLFLDGAEIGVDERGYRDGVLFHTPDAKLRYGKHVVEVVATDQDGGRTSERWTFTVKKPR